ncbi:hypothetical protein ACFVHI_36720 [Kitasatospora sp. NPDC127121]|uniref:hypothetical protein n=1 Tax=Kitasatospora sp. NPDC127121 TaxID=3345371 RepID=UPI003643ED90
MPAPRTPPARRLLPARLMLAGAWLWGAAPCYVLALRPSPGSPLPPRDQWGAAEEETSQLNGLVEGFTGFLILIAAAVAVWSWVCAARHLRRGSKYAPVLVLATALGSALLAVAGTRRIFHGLLGAPALGALVPLLALSVAALPVTRTAWSRRLPAAG